MSQLGIVKEIYRYPVKSFQGERIQQAEVGPYGMIGDRCHVFINHSRANKHLSAKQKPGLLGYSARYSTDDPRNAGLQVKSPDGREFFWNDELLQEVKTYTGLDLSLSRYPIEADGLAAVDAEPILIVTEEALVALEAIYGNALDVRRFRPNFVVRTDRSEGTIEFGWVGSSIRIGSAEFVITQKCERCMMVTVDPADLGTDPVVLKRIVDRLDACFGVYAQVAKPGRVVALDPVQLIDR